MGGSGGVRSTSMMRSYRVSMLNIGSLSLIPFGTYLPTDGECQATNQEIDYCNMLFSGPGAE